MKHLDGLNNMQKEAVLQSDGAVLMLAGAGSGKTRALTHRIAKLVEDGVNPFNILAITFTNKAAKEMRTRVNELVGGKGENIFISTFHSACVRFLRSDIDKLGSTYTKSFTIYDSDDQKAVIKLCYQRLNIDDANFKPNKIMSEISSQKDELIGSGEYERNAKGDYYKETVAKIYTMYQNLLRKNNALDFDDIIFLTVRLFKENPYVLEKYHERFRYIMVDEYQDTNTAQYVLVKTLAEKYKNLCVVGDDDQSIYGWRGANIENIYNFEKDFRDTKIIKLEQNYRSTQNILDVANAVIVNNLGRKSKRLWTENEDGTKIKLFAAENEHEEALYVVNEINGIKDETYKSFVILYRTNAQSRVLEDILIKKNVPYRILGGIRFYERKEIRDVLAYLRVLVNPNDDIAALRIVNVPKRGAGKVAIEKISKFANENEMSFFVAMQKLYEQDSGLLSPKLKSFVATMEELALSAKGSVVQLIEEMLDKTGYMMMLEDEGDEVESVSRIDNVKEFISKAAEYDRNADEISLAGFLEDVALVADIDNYSKDEDAVTLMTIHNSKGLEFPVVFLTGLEDGLFPSYNSITSPNRIEEERRLFYVGITRAEKTLYFTRAKSRMTRGITEYSAPSRFLKEIPADLIYIDKAGGRTIKPSVRTGDWTKPEYISNVTFNNVMKSVSKDVSIDFAEGDSVRHKKYGVGEVLAIAPAGRDYEVTVLFEQHGKKKFMAMLSGLTKA